MEGQKAAQCGWALVRRSMGSKEGDEVGEQVRPLSISQVKWEELDCLLGYRRPGRESPEGVFLSVYSEQSLWLPFQVVILGVGKVEWERPGMRQ